MVRQLFGKMVLLSLLSVNVFCAGSYTSRQIIKTKQPYDSFEEKVLRAGSNDFNRLLATDDAFRVGKLRMYYSQWEKDSIPDLYAKLGYKSQEDYDKACIEYSAVMEQINCRNRLAHSIYADNRDLWKKYRELSAMEKKIKSSK